MEYRLSVAYAKTDPASPDPVFETFADWKQAKSTKMDVCAQICKYYLYRDDVPDVSFVDGKPVFAPVGRFSEKQGHTRNRKILIYSEFPSVTGLLRKVGVGVFFSFFFHKLPYNTTELIGALGSRPLRSGHPRHRWEFVL